MPSHADAIAAESVVPGPPEVVFEFLVDLDAHWLLAGRFIDVVELEGPPGGRSGGRVRMYGPLRLRRTVSTVVEEVESPRLIRGTARVGRDTSARVEWTLAPDGEGTRVRLEARVLSASALDRFVLAAGGRWWLRRRFEGILRVLARHFAPGIGQGDRRAGP